MGEEFRYEHSAKGPAKRKRVVALEAFVEKCAEMNFVAFIVSVAFLVLRVAIWHGWMERGTGLLTVLGVSWWAALGVSLVMTVRLVFRVMKRVVRDRKEIGWSNVIFALAFGLGTWVISMGEIINFLRAMYIIMNL